MNIIKAHHYAECMDYWWSVECKGTFLLTEYLMSIPFWKQCLCVNLLLCLAIILLKRILVKNIASQNKLLQV